MVTILAVLVLGGGSAYATHLVVNGSDVVDDSLQSVDLQNGTAVKTADVVNDDATGGGLVSPDIRDDSLRGVDILNQSLTGADVTESSLGTVPHATNSDQLGGRGAGAYQRRVTGSCSGGTAVQSIGGGGTVSCSSPAVRPIAMNPVNGGVIASTDVGDLDVWASCRGTHVLFRSATSSTATLNWQFSEGTSSSTTVNASGTVVSPFSTVDFAYGTSGRLEGQWIFSTPQSITTVTLHAFQGPESCEVRGTAEWAPL
jgi:hypothetical protein